MGIISDKEKFARLRLSRTELIGARGFWNLVKKYGSAENAIGAVSDKYQICSLDDVYQELDKTKALGANLIFFEDEDYPPLLKQISDAPPMLTFLGSKENLKNFNKRESISVVGARNSSITANKFCSDIVSTLGHNDIVIVSGLARGLDAAAHKASLQTGTIAVLASGIDVVYPRENAKLYDQIKEQGIIFAEMPLGTTAQAHLFPKRNRIIAGLSSGTVVIEAAQQSGSLITAKCALEYGRDVFAAPGFPSDLKSEGSNRLLKEGAIMVLSADDILEHVFHRNYIQESLPLDKVEKLCDSDNIEACDYQNKILNLLSSVPITIDELIENTGLSPQNILMILLELELQNKIVRLSGQKICLSPVG